MTSSNAVQRAVRQALVISAATASASTALTAVAADSSEKTLTEVIVTGSRIRRVEAETANPVQIIDQQAIAQSGVATAGELVSRIPAIAGAATNAQVNNGGGFGEANIELRGLDAKRTLILVDGRRLGLVGQTGDATDVNQIPLGLIERVEVLKEGAGAIYGSDAVGGVVNFITRKSVEGLEVTTDYGRTGKRDGEHYSISAIAGTSSDKMSIMVGGSYTNQRAVSAGDREYSKFALYLYGGTTGVTKGGSSRTPNGRITLPTTGPLQTQFGCADVTRKAGAAGSTLADYRCFAGASDKFNFQPLNLLMTPQEHTAIFSKFNYHINDAVEVYATAIVNRTHSGFQIAPLPFDARTDDVVLSANSVYNKFGIDFGGLSGINPNFQLRLSAVGNRQSDTVSDSKVLNAGVRGALFDNKWTWDLNLTGSRLDQQASISGYLLKNSLQPALGPSYTDATGPHCGVAPNPISGCIPVNFFNPTAAGQAAAIASISSGYNTANTFRYQAAALEFSGPLFALPAGDLQMSIGADYSNREGSFIADSIVQATPPLYLQCQLANETCTGNTVGSYNSKQAYAEFYIPLLKDLPAVHSLSLDIGVRHSGYDTFGDATKGDFKLEYRPIADLLIRGTYSQVFRVPTVSDIAASPANTSVTFNDPCTNLTSAMLVANPNLNLACQNVAPNTNFAEPNGQITGLNLSNPDLKPERGNVFTFGFVYEPQFVSGLSLEVDYWDVKIKDLITLLDSNFSINQCVTTGSPQFCSLVTRFGAGPSAGQILVFQNPTINLGELHTKGIDFGVKYALRNTAAGNFQFTLDATRIATYENTPGPGVAPIEVVGTFDRQFGNYAQWRGMAGVGWNMGGFDTLLSARYIHHLVLHDPSVTHVQADLVTPYPDLQIPSVAYFDLAIGYTFAATNTKIQIGGANLTDKQPPTLYLNNVANANTDVQTYDTIGRRWWVSLSQKF